MELNRLKKMVFFVWLLFFSGCTPIGHMGHSDFNWTIKTLDIPYQQVYRNIEAGFRCHRGWYPSGQLYTDIQEGHFDLYATPPDPLFGRLVYGKIIIKSLSERKSKLSIGVTHHFDKPIFSKRGKPRETILQWAKGEYPKLD